MEKTYYTPIENTNTFINQIVDKYDDTFKIIRIYGTNENPLFVARDVYAILFNKNINDPQIDKNLSGCLLQFINDGSKYQELIKECPLQITKTIKNTKYKTVVKMNALTKYGVYRMMFISNKPIAATFRTFVYIVLDELELKQKAYLTDAINKLEDEMKKKTEQYSRKFNEQNKKINRLNVRDQKHFEMCGAYYEFNNRINQIENNHDADEYAAYQLGLHAYELDYGKPATIMIHCDEIINATIQSDLFSKKKIKSKKLKVNNNIDHTNDSDNDENNIAEVVIDAADVSDPSDSSDFIDKSNFKTQYDLPNYEINQNATFSEMNTNWIREFISDIPKYSNYEEEYHLYFSITKLGAKVPQESDKQKVWATLYFFNSDHYKKFITATSDLLLAKQIPKLKSKSLRNLYKCSYQAISNIHQEILGQVAIHAIKTYKKSIAKPDIVESNKNVEHDKLNSTNILKQSTENNVYSDYTIEHDENIKKLQSA